MLIKLLLFFLFHHHEVVLQILHFLRFQYFLKNLQTWKCSIDHRFTTWNLQEYWEVIRALNKYTHNVDLVLNITLFHHFFNFLGLDSAYDFFSVGVLSFELFLYLLRCNFGIIFLEHCGEYLSSPIDHFLMPYSNFGVQSCLLLKWIKFIRPNGMHGESFQSDLDWLWQNIFNLVDLLIVPLLEHYTDAV